MKATSKLSGVYVKPTLTHTFEIGNITVVVQGYYEIGYKTVKNGFGGSDGDEMEYDIEDKVSLICEDWEYISVTENGVGVGTPCKYIEHKKGIGVDIDKIVWGYIQEGQPKILEQIMNTTIKNIEI